MGRTPRKAKDLKPRRWRQVVAALLTLILVGGLLFTFNHLGSEALRGIGPRERYRVPFADIHCNAPPGLDRPTFLTEVRYISAIPETFNALDETDRVNLARVFSLHPWVERVEGISVEAGNVVTVRLAFREPALSVPVEGGGNRLVDAKGILLPESAKTTATVAELLTAVPPPALTAGHVWPDPTVKRALELVAGHHPKSLVKTRTDWRLVLPDGRTLHAAN